jgi:hypothetical protein
MLLVLEGIRCALLSLICVALLANCLAKIMAISSLRFQAAFHLYKMLNNILTCWFKLIQQALFISVPILCYSIFTSFFLNRRYPKLFLVAKFCQKIAAKDISGWDFIPISMWLGIVKQLEVALLAIFSRWESTEWFKRKFMSKFTASNHEHGWMDEVRLLLP